MIDFKRAVGKSFRAIAFNRRRSVASCIAFSGLSFLLELRFPGSDLFASSGAIFTLGGFLLNIKQSAIFHRQAPDGSPLPTRAKYYSITRAATFASETPDEAMNAKVRSVEADEIWGCVMVVLGTVLWGYGGWALKAFA
ncbi:TPA: hypothetical protein QDZ75_003729 [Stenotrophomonas maltophilia]|nr:hypothetical protein [Stenotrophomonas maltophilia]